LDFQIVDGLFPLTLALSLGGVKVFFAGISPTLAHVQPAMSKRRKILLLLAGLVLAFGVYMLFIRESEPSYKGKPLSFWVEGLNPSPARTNRADRSPGVPEAPEAIRQIGSNAIPYLLKWIQYEGPGKANDCRLSG
jgi:hypothetical protein